jgi:hypothetical protein
MNEILLQFGWIEIDEIESADDIALLYVLILYRLHRS